MEWKNPGPSSYRGYVGKIELFSIHWASQKSPDGMYLMETRLPQFGGSIRDKRWQTVEDAQQAAEDLLDEFMKYMTENR